MQWRGRRQSSNVRRTGAPAVAGGGILVLALVVWLIGGDPMAVLQQEPEVSMSSDARPMSADEEEMAAFVSVVLADTEDVWAELFRREGADYVYPELVLFQGSVRSACGMASAAVGPFYCPADRSVYLDLVFFAELASRFGAAGDFAQAYVIAHEVGHHVQNLAGATARLDALRRQVTEEEYNRLSVRLELQADFYAGVWAHHAQRTKQILDPGDIEEALGAAAAIGDDRLQMQAQGYVLPDSFTHGTSAQRVAWFRRGFETGDLRAGDTFDDAVFESVRIP